MLVRIPLFFPVNKPERFDTWQEQLSDWWRQTLETIDPFRATRLFAREDQWQNDYNGALWTIPIEYKGSIQVFVLLLMFGMTKKSWIRWVGILSVAWWQLVQGDADMTLFCAGLVLAEAHILRQRRTGRGPWEITPKPARHLVTVLVFLAALHLLSYPDIGGQDSPGFATLSRMVPEYYYVVLDFGGEDMERMQHYWLSIGAILFVWAVMYSPPVRPLFKIWPWRILSDNDSSEGDRFASDEAEEEEEPFLQKLFTNDFCQYLGKISYSLYLWHTPIQNRICWKGYIDAEGAWKAALTTAVELEKSGLHNEAAAALGQGRRAFTWAYTWTLIFDGLGVFWISDVFYRSVDVYSVRLARRVWEWISGVE
ncbi:hypothetical protein V8F20_003904 [Naviculisporaceae sp. PSN 640]